MKMKRLIRTPLMLFFLSSNLIAGTLEDFDRDQGSKGFPSSSNTNTKQKSDDRDEVDSDFISAIFKMIFSSSDADSTESAQPYFDQSNSYQSSRAPIYQPRHDTFKPYSEPNFQFGFSPGFQAEYNHITAAHFSGHIQIRSFILQTAFSNYIEENFSKYSSRESLTLFSILLGKQWNFSLFQSQIQFLGGFNLETFAESKFELGSALNFKMGNLYQFRIHSDLFGNPYSLFQAGFYSFQPQIGFQWESIGIFAGWLERSSFRNTSLRGPTLQFVFLLGH